MEAIANSVEDKLIEGLSFKSKAGASYITERKSVTFHPSGSNAYQPQNGTKLIKILMTGVKIFEDREVTLNRPVVIWISVDITETFNLTII